jgi:hypothetical protein
VENTNNSLTAVAPQEGPSISVVGDTIQALSLAKDCYLMKLNLLTNATVVDDAIRFVSDRSDEKLKSSSDNSKDGKEESNEPDYDEDQLEEKQQVETGEITSATTNHIF